MKKKLVMLTLTVLVAAAVLLFVGCPEEGGGKSYVGTWEFIDTSGGASPDPPPDAGDIKQVFTLTASTWEFGMHTYGGAAWIALAGFSGTMTGSGDTLTVTLTQVSAPNMFAPYYYYPGWYDDTYWDYYNNYYLWYIYYYHFYYVTGSITMDITYSLSGDGNTLVLTVPGEPPIMFTRVV